MKACRLWYRAHIHYASLEQRECLDLQIWYNASTHSQLEFAQWMALQASLNKDRKSQLSCPLSMTYRNSFHAVFGSQCVVWEEIEKTSLCSIRSQSTQTLPLDIGSEKPITHRMYYNYPRASLHQPFPSRINITYIMVLNRQTVWNEWTPVALNGYWLAPNRSYINEYTFSVLRWCP